MRYWAFVLWSSAVPAPIQTQAFPRLLQLMRVNPAYFDLSLPEDQVPKGYEWRQGDYLKQAKRIHDAFALQDGELTAQLLLSGALAQVEKETAFTLAEVLKDPTGFDAMRQMSKEIRAVLNSDRAVEDRVTFSEVLEGALAHYGVRDDDKVRNVIDNDFALGELRFNAMNAVHTLRLTQFLQGDVGEVVRPQYNTVIRRWWSMDHMLAAQTTLPEGVSLNLITAGSSHDLFFCYAVRRGANLYLMHDSPDYSHPLQSSKSRRPDRALANRINQFYFPYELANVYMSEDGSEANPRDSLAGERVTALDILGRKDDFSRVIGTIADLSPVEMIWNAMMFDLIMDKFWSPAPLPALSVSYTAGQLKSDSQLLLETAQAAGLPVLANASAVVAVPDLTVASVAGLHLQESAKEVLGKTSQTPLLKWMEERYAHLVTDEAINPVADGKQLPRLNSEGRFEMVSVEQHAQGVTIFERDNPPVFLEALGEDAFGTAEKLKADRGFLARNNYADSLSKFAHLEFQDQEDEIREWVATAYQARKDFLLSLVPAAHAQQLKIQDWVSGNEALEGIDLRVMLEQRIENGTDAPSFYRSNRGVSHQLGQLTELNKETTLSYHNTYVGHASGNRGNWRSSCVVTGAAVSYCAQFAPSNSLELAWLLGKQVEELPDLLQNYNRIDLRVGNSILDRIDPMIWALKNPWDNVVFPVRLGLSKRGLAQLLKNPGPEPDLSSLQFGNTRFFTGEVRYPMSPWSPPGAEATPGPARRRGPGMR